MSINAAFIDVPVLDLSARHGSQAQRAEIADTMRQICHHIGFLVVTNHGVSQSLLDDVFRLSRALFALPLEQKMFIDKCKSRHFRGWEPVGTEHTNNRPDYREQVDLWSEHSSRAVNAEPAYLRLLGPNQWLPEALLPGFQDTLNEWFSALGQLADELMALLALGLELPENHFESRFGEERMSLTKLIHYPATPPNSFGVNAHHDAGILTVLAPGETPGLEVENAAGEWIGVPIVARSLVINLGEVFQSMTGNYFIATSHRVVTSSERYSAGYFHGPSLDTMLSPLDLGRRFTDAVAASPRHRSAGFMAQRNETALGVADMSSPHHPDVYGEQLWNYFARSYPRNMRQHYPQSRAKI
jgi:isopenicillin N synthase-like dioxygenase